MCVCVCVCACVVSRSKGRRSGPKGFCECTTLLACVCVCVCVVSRTEGCAELARKNTMSAPWLCVCVCVVVVVVVVQCCFLHMYAHKNTYASIHACCHGSCADVTECAM